MQEICEARTGAESQAEDIDGSNGFFEFVDQVYSEHFEASLLRLRAALEKNERERPAQLLQAR